jgi:hypothetical protein
VLFNIVAILQYMEFSRFNNLLLRNNGLLSKCGVIFHPTLPGPSCGSGGHISVRAKNIKTENRRRFFGWTSQISASLHSA